MAPRPDFVEFAVDGATLGALRWSGIAGAPTIVAIHDLAANAWAWDPFAHHLNGAAQVIAVDLRGRGRSHQQPGPYGVRQHADDVAAIIDAVGGPLTLIGHAMGAYVVTMAAERHPALLSDLMLVDGGAPLPRVAHDPIDDALEMTLGVAVQQLDTIWPDRVSYQSMWAQHPAFADGISPDLERNLLGDLVEVDGGFRIAANADAIRLDGTELLADDEVRTVLDRHPQPATIIRAEFGITGERPPFISDDIRDRYPQHHWIEAHGLNHHTIMNSAPGATLLADALRDVLTAPS